MLNLTRFQKPKLSTLKAKLRNFRADKDGVAAVEFAIISPLMIALYFGLVEISLLIQANKTVSHATNVAGDLATQVANVDRDDMEDVLEATLSTMSIKPEDISGVGVEILSYRMTPAGDREIIGSAVLNSGVTGAPFDPEDIGPRLLAVGSGAIVARMQYQYESVTYKFVEQFALLEETFVLKPRSSEDIPFSTDGSVVTFSCSAAGSIEVTCAEN